MDHTPRKKHDAQRLANFIENVRYYCEYNSKRMPDEKFIVDNWKKEVPLDELVEKYELGGLGRWNRKGT